VIKVGKEEDSQIPDQSYVYHAVTLADDRCQLATGVPRDGNATPATTTTSKKDHRESKYNVIKSNCHNELLESLTIDTNWIKAITCHIQRSREIPSKAQWLLFILRNSSDAYNFRSSVWINYKSSHSSR
jgi:hypothetical protein